MEVEQVWGWDEEEHRQVHERRFAWQHFQVIQVSGLGVGILAIVGQPDCMRVNQMFILPKHQSRGVGAACMMGVIEDAVASELPVRLQVLKVNNRAVAFYQRLGFRSIGKSDAHVLMERQS